ncbi:MAG: hypothetical protein E7440_00160 [Ruminococcaceae bacterium]|nr:hypothetical protein [Oscillospiraceae bacterium]
MAQKKKRVAPGKNPGVLQREKDTKKMEPAARRLLLAAVVVIALAQVLEYGLGLITHGVGNLICLLGVVLLGAFFVVQAKGGKSRL